MVVSLDFDEVVVLLEQLNQEGRGIAVEYIRYLISTGRYLPVEEKA